MLQEEHIKEPSFSEQVATVVMWTVTILTWLIVLGCALFGLAVLLWRELEKMI
jgi:hypothetical protein